MGCASSSPCRAVTSSRSTTAVARRGSTSSTSATRPPRASRPKAGRRSRASRAWRARPPGPGVTNGMSALGSAQQNNSPMVVLGGRAPAMRWGRARCRRSTTSRSCVRSSSGPPPRHRRPRSQACRRRVRDRHRPHTGPVFLDFPLDHVFMEAEEPEPGPAAPGAGRGAGAADPSRSSAPSRCCAGPSAP
jgi:hypothetical protein